MLDWWKRLSRTAKVFGAIGIISSAIVSVAAAYSIIEPAIPAHRGLVREYVPLKIAEAISPQTEALYELQRDNAERDCEKVADEIINMSAILPREPDDIARQRKAFQLEQKKQRFNDLDNKLRGWRAGRGCPYSTGQ